MTDGKLVRDRIPEIIREAGRNPDVRYVSGNDLVTALAAKLQEEAAEAADAVADREALIEELADVAEVVSALMSLHHIAAQEIIEVAAAKAASRGRFSTGAWLVSAVPDAIRRYSAADVEAQRVQWIPDRWTATFKGREHAHADLRAHSAEAGGIARNFIHARAGGDPVELFLIAMAWGYRPKDYGPARTQAVLQADGAEEKIAAIVQATREDGAAAGWHALLVKHKITGLNMAFGTKLLYFAGYATEHRPRPLILDARVRASLQNFAPGTVPARGLVRQADYLRYLDLAEQWASDPGWKQAPDVVEYGLFAQ
ncbi:nucleoside triphosphate pyrophosphohydrolase [Mycolicibacterium sp. BiH015]|uniref:nucleoside triphosphate pyrophosphohydrolase n=1 Tax=Mycolicibacterium sp. BiH015 TaxID=3018808 RepID=UPI0022E62E38|nr:nucleoside triphosphate pyrophosphohydrolase [Mycolicibacterium sp. BiH015]MDA2895504.1 nucleoside triphosphate pyrophosphohydrolase [Mycolicibacterium sp. BiH015]